MKKLRYLYWLVLEFIRKYKIIFFSTFVISFIVITFFSSATQNFFSNKKRIGYVGLFSPNYLPEEILQLISNPLLIADEKGSYTPILLSSWEVSENYKKYRLNLKKNILWNDGLKLTTDNLDLKVKDGLIKKLAPYTILITFQNPTPNFLKYLSKPLIRNNFIGAAGKYKIKRYKIKNGLVTYLLLSPNLSHLPVLEYRFFSTEEEMVVNYKLGKIDLMTVKKKELADNFVNWRNSKVTKLVDYKHLFTLFFNNDKELFQDRNFKKAIAKAINKKKLSSFGLENQSPVALNSLFYNPNLSADVYSPDYIIEYMNSHFKATMSAKIKFNLYTYYEYFNLAEEISNQLNQVNIEVKTIFIRQQIPKDFDLLLTLLEIPSIEDQYFLWHSQQKATNISNYKNELVDKLLEDLRLSIKYEEKKKAADDFQKIFNENPGAIFLYHPYVYLIERK